MVMLSLISKFNYYYSILKSHKCTILYNHTNVTILKCGMKKGGEGIVKAATKVVGENSSVLSSQSQNIPNVNTPQSNPQSSPNTSPQNSPGSSPQLTPPSSPTNSPQSNCNTSPKLSNTPIKEKDFSNIKPGYYGFFQFSQINISTQNKDNPNRFITDKKTFNLPKSKIQNKTEWAKNSNGTWFKQITATTQTSTNNTEQTNIPHTQNISTSQSNNNNNETNQTTITTTSNINDNIPIPPTHMPPKQVYTKPSGSHTEELQNIAKALNNKSNNNNASNLNLKPSDVKAAVLRAQELKLLEFGHASDKEISEIKQAGELKLTDQGRVAYNTVKDKSSNQPLISFNSNIEYQVGVLKANDESVILLAEHTHLVVVFNKDTNQYIGVGIFTSQNSSDTIKISDTQYDNLDKKQYYRPLSQPLIIKEQDISIKTNMNEYIENLDHEQLNKSTEKQLAKNPIIYDQKGVTMYDLINMINYQEKQPLPKPKKISHNEEVKQQKSAQKMKENQEKQKLKAKEEKELKIKQENEFKAKELEQTHQNEPKI